MTQVTLRKDAILDPTGRYRYALSREWTQDARRVVFIMLNPSTADHTIDDPTIRRCIDFARRWGYGGLEVVNLFALRATNPADLKVAKDPVGPDNNYYIEDVLRRVKAKGGRVVLAWGAQGTYMGRDAVVLKILNNAQVTSYHLGQTKKGMPRHPLYLPANSPVIEFGTWNRSTSCL